MRNNLYEESQNGNDLSHTKWPGAIVSDFRQDQVRHWIRSEPSTIVLQPTTLCPLNCKYCYLPKRHLKYEMSSDVTTAIVRSLPMEWLSGNGLEPEPVTPRLEKAEVRLTLTSVGGAVAPIAWSMTPMRITHSSELTTTVQLGPQLALFGVEASLGSVERGRTEQRQEVYLEGLNALRSDPAWELRRTSTMELRGSHRLAMVVRTERGATTTIGGCVHAAVRGGSFLRREHSDLPRPLTVSAQL